MPITPKVFLVVVFVIRILFVQFSLNTTKDYFWVGVREQNLNATGSVFALFSSMYRFFFLSHAYERKKGKKKTIYKFKQIELSMFQNRFTSRLLLLKNS